MKANSLLTFLSFLLIAQVNIHAQESDRSVPLQTKFNNALQEHVRQLMVDFGEYSIDQERFLIQQIRMINQEIKNRVSGIDNVRRNYFERLQDRLAEVRLLKQRLSGYGPPELIAFIDNLESKIEATIDGGIINYQRQRFIDDAVQLLYIAEEVVKLDPNASLRENPKFSETFRDTRVEMRETFGSKVDLEARVEEENFSANNSIFDLYSEWRRSERVKYKLRWTDLRIIKNRLLENGSQAEKERMFQRELRQASEAFNYGYYDLAQRSFGEILKRYGFIGQLDDCRYFRARANYELNRFNEARDDFQILVREYPSSSYLISAYTHLIEIGYHFKEFDQVLTWMRKLQTLAPVNDERLYVPLLLATQAALRAGQFEDAVKFAYEIPAKSQYGNQARYILAEAYFGLNNFEEARNLLEALLQKKNLNPGFRFDILLKLGMISYEEGNYAKAINYFDRINGNYEHYDRVLMAYAWAFYQIELQKQLADNRDFSRAKKYIDILLDVFYASEYTLEAKSLLAYIQQLENRPRDAIENYEYAYKSKDFKLLSDDFNSEQEQLMAKKDDLDAIQEKALENKNMAAFERAERMKEKIEQPLFELKYMDLSSVGVAAKNEIERLNSELDELQRLKAKAKERGSKQLVSRIKDLEMKIYKAVNAVPVTKPSKLGINYFDDHPLARKASVIEQKNQTIRSMRNDIQGQREMVAMRLDEIERRIEEAKAAKQFKQVVQLELARDRFKEIEARLDYLQTRAFAMDIESSDINLDRWSDYGAFGMANVNFAIKKMQADQVSYMQKQIQAINNFLQTRKENVEHKIEQINNEITLMTRQVRRQERLREREELDRQFEESYFDTHDSEIDYEQNQDNTQPPSNTEPPKIDTKTDQE